MNNLYAALSEYIERVKGLKPTVNFTMYQWNQCVIGRTTGWCKCSSNIFFDESETLEVWFGIVLDDYNDRSGLFGDTSANLYTPEQWDVIRLFTSVIGNELSRDEWLELAEDQLSKMNSGEMK